MLLVVGNMTSSPLASNPYPWSRRLAALDATRRGITSKSGFPHQHSYIFIHESASRFADPRGPTEEVEGSAKVA
jgi:hypothetical protein